jgi:phage tail sheath gpL-like
VTLPLAANPTSPTPGLWLRVDLVPSTASPGSSTLRALIAGPKNQGAGDITVETEIRTVYSLSEVETAAGVGSLPALAYAALTAADPMAQVDLICPTASAGNQAAGAIALSGTVVDGTACCFIDGVEIQVPIYAGEALTVWRDRAVELIGRHAHEIHYTPSAGSAGSVTLTAKAKGPAGNDGVFRCKLIDASGMTLAATQPSAGSTELDYSTALGNCASREYDYIGLCLSNADAESTTGSVADLQDHINGHNSGLGAKLQQGVVGHIGTIAQAKVVTAVLNDQVMQYKTCSNAEALPCQVMADEIGDRMKRRRLEYNANRIGTLMRVPGSSDPIGDAPIAPTETDDALSHGVSLCSYNSAGLPYLLRAVTTYQETTGGSAVLCTDCNEVDALYDFAKDLRTKLITEYSGKKVTESATEASDTPEEPLPENVVETNEIKASIVAVTEGFWIPKGVIDRTSFRAAVDPTSDGEKLAVSVNDTDETQVDIYIPAKACKVLAKIGVYVRKVA